MPQLLFLVHGMGEFRQNWSRDVVKKLDEVATRYPSVVKQLKGKAFSERVIPVEIRYDEVFSRLITEWDQSVTQLQQFIPQNEKKLDSSIDVGDVLGWLTRSAKPSEQQFFWSHAVDVLLYKFFPIVTDQVRLTVQKQFAQALKGPRKTASVLAHSLGTRVMHDSLSLLGTQAFDGGSSFLAGTGFTFDNIFTVANVIRAVGKTYPDEPDEFKGSCVHPPSAKSINSSAAYCASYFAFTHELDPFTIRNRFEPTWGVDFIAPKPLSHIADWNVHSFPHFLDHPSVHVPILNQLVSIDDPVISEEVEAVAVANYRAPSLPPCLHGLVDFRARVREILDDVEGDAGAQNLVIAIARFFAAVEEARDACK